MTEPRTEFICYKITQGMTFKDKDDIEEYCKSYLETGDEQCIKCRSDNPENLYPKNAVFGSSSKHTDIAIFKQEKFPFHPFDLNMDGGNFKIKAIRKFFKLGKGEKCQNCGNYVVFRAFLCRGCYNVYLKKKSGINLVLGFYNEILNQLKNGPVPQAEEINPLYEEKILTFFSRTPAEEKKFNKLVDEIENSRQERLWPAVIEAVKYLEKKKPNKRINILIEVLRDMLE